MHAGQFRSERFSQGQSGGDRVGQRGAPRKPLRNRLPDEGETVVDDLVLGEVRSPNRSLDEPLRELKGVVKLSARGEIEINARGETSVPGVFAAGDCTVVPYKQIVIAMGEGAKASLSAFDYLIRAPLSAAA